MIRELQPLQIDAKGGVLAMRGALNRAEAPQAWKTRQAWLPKENTTEVALDLSGLNTVDSAGLAFFIQLKAALKQQGKTLVLHQVNPQLIAFAKVSGITEAFLNIQSVAEQAT